MKYQSEKKPLREFAILFKTGRESYLLEAKLNKAGIPYVKHGGPKFINSRKQKLPPIEPPLDLQERI